jgi:hypothetical protein
LVGSFDLIHQLFKWLDFGPVPPSVLSSAYSLARMRDKLLSAHADFCGSALCLMRRVSRGGQCDDHSNGQPGHCGRPASLLRSVTRLPKVFIGGLEVDLCLLRLCWFEPEIFEGDPTGLQSPQINGEQASTGHDRSFSRSSTSHSVSTKDVRKLLKAPPGGVPFL